MANNNNKISSDEHGGPQQSMKANSGSVLSPSELNEPNFQRFLELRLEIRGRIYQYAFSSSSGVIGTTNLRNSRRWGQQSMMWKNRETRTSPIDLALLRANHQIYHEALLILYSSFNTIVITTRKMRRMYLYKFLQMPGPLAKCKALGCPSS
jgi:hypothetical protein